MIAEQMWAEYFRLIGNRARAIDFYTCLTEHPERYALYSFRIATLLWEEGERARAVALWQNMGIGSKLVDRCLLAWRSGNPESIRRDCELAHAVSPENETVTAIWGMSIAYEDEKKSLLQILDVDRVAPDVRLLLALGEYYRISGEVQKALKAGERALMLDKRHPSAHVLLGRLYLAQRNYTLAEKYLKTGIQNSKQPSGFLYLLYANTLVALGRMNDAVLVYGMALTQAQQERDYYTIKEATRALSALE